MELSDDLIYIEAEDISPAKITKHVQERFSKDQIYTRIGEKVLLVLNPFKTLPSSSDDVMKSIKSAVKCGEERQAHIYEMAANAYFQTIRSKKDHAILFYGESGSGKTECYKMALKQIVSCSKSRKKEDKIPNRLLKSSIILDAFGCAKTIQNPNSSRYGKVLDIQLNTKGKLSGAKISDYLLDKERTTRIPAGERAFHVFYYLLAGSTADEKNQMQLFDPSKYKYLSGSKVSRSFQQTDGTSFLDLKLALKGLGIREKYQTQIFQTLSAILHIGNLEFEEGRTKEEAAVVQNTDILDIVSTLIGVQLIDLENSLVYKTKVIKNEICSIFLDIVEASKQKDMLAQALYNTLWAWIVESLNKRLVDDYPQINLSLIDMFGIENIHENTLQQLLTNFASEKLFATTQEVLIYNLVGFYNLEGISVPDLETTSSNQDIISLLCGPEHSILDIIEEESKKSAKKAKASNILEEISGSHSNNENLILLPGKSKVIMFGVRHHTEDVNYDCTSFITDNLESISPDFVNLFCGGPDNHPSKNSFLVNLFRETRIAVEKDSESGQVVKATYIPAPHRKPTVNKKVGITDGIEDTKTNNIRQAMDFVVASLEERECSFVFTVTTNSSFAPNRFEAKTVESQITFLGIQDVLSVRQKAYGYGFKYKEFSDTYMPLLSDVDYSLSPRQLTESIISLYENPWVAFGSSSIFIGDSIYRSLENQLKIIQKAEKDRLQDKLNSNFANDDNQSDVSNESFSMAGTSYSEDDLDDASQSGSDYTFYSQGGDKMKSILTRGTVELKGPEEAEEEMSRVRKNWIFVVKLFTWWIPTRMLQWNGMTRADIQQAWREKLTLVMLILLLSLTMLFFITGFNLIMCPHNNLYNQIELMNYVDPAKGAWLAVHGNVFDVTAFQYTHKGGAGYLMDYFAKDATPLFPLDASACGLSVDGKPFVPDVEFAHNPSNWMPLLQKSNKKMWKGFLAFQKADVALKKNHSAFWIIVNSNVYDFSAYMKYEQNYFGDEVSQIIRSSGGGDASVAFAKTPAAKKALPCMNTVHFVGVIDTRDSIQCVFADSILLASTAVLVSIMVIKFLSALQFGSKGDPESNDRFVILQVPCYTESEESLKKAIDSLATLRYDDKRKLLFIIVDGNIIGSGNDRATWRIVLDLLGVDSTIDPPKLSFQSLGEGNKQHNMGKIYTGLYDVQGHLVPYIMVCKMGKDNERSKPGNRGKRDSQLILMRFLQKVHYDEPMSPLELELFHQIKNIIGVDPSFYEFVLMVDADTEVLPDSLNRLISCMVHDAKIVGICGETTISNERDSFITMMQVYEYYISHHLAKAFESLFGSVTCLPGCFCLYRIRTPNKSIPLLIAKPVVSDYSENNVDTLHKKNLLSLGEDRYLTTLMLKHFPHMKISFTSDSQCRTYAPDRWSVLLSQRRRWINSTVHNLAELLLLPQLCGFCCFSMRFVVFFDLFATLVMPATMGYLLYLIYNASTNRYAPIISLILIAAGFGLQVLIFIFKRKWEHIGWLVIYILALPFFTFFIPVYAFWHFDDFSWGSTRIVVGEKGGRKQIIDEEPFDPNSIPMKSWSEYEQERWENESSMTKQTGYAQSEARSQYTAPPSVHSGIPNQYYPPSYTPSGVNYPISGSVVGPSDEQIVAQIKLILATADLMKITKKQIRNQLGAFFGIDLTFKKDFINSVIEDLLKKG